MVTLNARKSVREATLNKTQTSFTIPLSRIASAGESRDTDASRDTEDVRIDIAGKRSDLACNGQADSLDIRTRPKQNEVRYAL